MLKIARPVLIIAVLTAPESVRPLRCAGFDVCKTPGAPWRTTSRVDENERSAAMVALSTGNDFPDVVVGGVAMTTALATAAATTWKNPLDGSTM
jgi:hypothetical protein